MVAILFGAFPLLPGTPPRPAAPARFHRLYLPISPPVTWTHPRLHVLLQMLSNETFTAFLERAPASSLLDSALAIAPGRAQFHQRSLPCPNPKMSNPRRSSK